MFRPENRQRSRFGVSLKSGILILFGIAFLVMFLTTQKQLRTSPSKSLRYVPADTEGLTKEFQKVLAGQTGDASEKTQLEAEANDKVNNLLAEMLEKDKERAAKDESQKKLSKDNEELLAGLKRLEELQKRLDKLDTAKKEEPKSDEKIETPSKVTEKPKADPEDTSADSTPDLTTGATGSDEPATSEPETSDEVVENREGDFGEANSEEDAVDVEEVQDAPPSPKPKVAAAPSPAPPKKEQPVVPIRVVDNAAAKNVDLSAYGGEYDVVSPEKVIECKRACFLFKPKTEKYRSDGENIYGYASVYLRVRMTTQNFTRVLPVIPTFDGAGTLQTCFNPDRSVTDNHYVLALVRAGSEGRDEERLATWSVESEPLECRQITGKMKRCLPLLDRTDIPMATDFGVFDSNGHLFDTSKIELRSGESKTLIVKPFPSTLENYPVIVRHAYFNARMRNKTVIQPVQFKTDPIQWDNDAGGYVLEIAGRDPTPENVDKKGAPWELQLHLTAFFGDAELERDVEEPSQATILVGDHMGAGHGYDSCHRERSYVFGIPAPVTVTDVKEYSTPPSRKCKRGDDMFNGRWVQLPSDAHCQPPLCTGNTTDLWRPIIINEPDIPLNKPWIWVPYDTGCYLHYYTPSDVLYCAKKKNVDWVLILGDSPVREIFNLPLLQFDIMDDPSLGVKFHHADIMLNENSGKDKKATDVETQPGLRWTFEAWPNYNQERQKERFADAKPVLAHFNLIKDDPMSGKPNLRFEGLRRTETTKPDVFVFNPAMAYAVMLTTTDEFEAFVSELKAYFANIDKSAYLMYFRPPYVHGHYKTPLNEYRSRLLSVKLEKVLTELGFVIFDPHQITSLRTESFYDGLHSMRSAYWRWQGSVGTLLGHILYNVVFDDCAGEGVATVHSGTVSSGSENVDAERQRAEEEKKRQQAEVERKEEEERKRKAEEAQKAADEQKKRAEQEQKQKDEEEQERKRKEAEDAEKSRKAAEDAERKQKEEAAEKERKAREDEEKRKAKKKSAPVQKREIEPPPLPENIDGAPVIHSGVEEGGVVFDLFGSKYQIVLPEYIVDCKLLPAIIRSADASIPVDKLQQLVSVEYQPIGNLSRSAGVVPLHDYITTLNDNIYETAKVEHKYKVEDPAPDALHVRASDVGFIIKPDSTAEKGLYRLDIAVEGEGKATVYVHSMDLQCRQYSGAMTTCLPVLNMNLPVSTDFYVVDRASGLPLKSTERNPFAVRGSEKTRLVIRPVDPAYIQSKFPQVFERTEFLARVRNDTFIQPMEFDLQYDESIQGYPLDVEVRDGGRFELEVVLHSYFGDMKMGDKINTTLVGDHMGRGHGYSTCHLRRSNILGSPYTLDVTATQSAAELFANRKCEWKDVVDQRMQGRWVKLPSDEACVPPMCSGNSSALWKTVIKHEPFVDKHMPWVWSPYQCYYHHYTKEQFSKCAEQKKVKWVHIMGDSPVREVYNIVLEMFGFTDDPNLGRKFHHADLTVGGVRYTFEAWPKFSKTRSTDMFSWTKDHMDHFRLKYPFDDESGKKLGWRYDDLDREEPERPDVFIFNFAMAYTIMRTNITAFDEWLDMWKEYMGTSFRNDLHPDAPPIRAVYYIPPFVHGHYAPTLSAKRAFRYQALVEKKLSGMGISYFDSTTLTSARTELSYDGIHYMQSAHWRWQGSAAIMLGQITLNMMFEDCQ